MVGMWADMLDQCNSANIANVRELFVFAHQLSRYHHWTHNHWPHIQNHPRYLRSAHAHSDGL